MPDVLAAILWIALGSALGGPARYFVSGVIGRSIGETFPWGTILVNVTGCLVVGALAAAAAAGGGMSAPAAWQFAVTGFLGSYTTVSSFSLQTLALARDGQIWRAGGNVACSVVLCLCATVAGYYCVASALGGAVR